MAKFLSSWKPRYEISQDVEILVANFVGTRGKKYAEKTFLVEKKDAIYMKQKQKQLLQYKNAK